MLIFHQVNDASRQLQEEQDTCMSISNSMKKLVGDTKRFKEMVENMENKLSQCEDDKVRITF